MFNVYDNCNIMLYYDCHERWTLIILSVVSKIFEILVSNRLFDHLEKCGFFSDFSMV